MSKDNWSRRDGWRVALDRRWRTGRSNGVAFARRRTIKANVRRRRTFNLNVIRVSSCCFDLDAASAATTPYTSYGGSIEHHRDRQRVRGSPDQDVARFLQAASIDAVVGAGMQSEALRRGGDTRRG